MARQFRLQICKVKYLKNKKRNGANVKKYLYVFLLIVSMCLSPNSANADVWGADVAVLTQILAQTIAQLAQLKAILKNGGDTLGLLEEVNRGINDSLSLASTLGIRVDPGLYKNLRDVDGALFLVETVFGRAVESPLAVTQRNTDRTVAESISFNNELDDYTRNLDRVGEDIKVYSHQVSPGGAAKLTAESMGVMIHVMNQQIRATGQGLKLQAQGLAMQNKHEKDQTGEYLNQASTLKNKMMSLDAPFDLPRF